MNGREEAYTGPITVAFDDIPPVRLQSIRAKADLNLLQRLALWTKPREFTLHEDWLLDFDGVSYAPELNGTLRIPARDTDGKEIVYDGASVPLPWLVSLLTSGVLRPLGVMLTASLIHDYAFKYGHLQKEDATPVKLERNVADRLFRDVIATVAELPYVAFVAWFAVRLGWPVVRYNGQLRGGKAPILEYLALAILLFVLLNPATGFNLLAAISLLVAIYVLVYLVTAAMKRENLVEKKEDRS
jgi:hypothetical protein